MKVQQKLLLLEATSASGGAIFETIQTSVSSMGAGQRWYFNDCPMFIADLGLAHSVSYWRSIIACFQWSGFVGTALGQVDRAGPIEVSGIALLPTG